LALDLGFEIWIRKNKGYDCFVLPNWEIYWLHQQIKKKDDKLESQLNLYRSHG